MLDSQLVLFYVSSVADSEAFYAELLGRKAVESSPTFAMFVLPSGLKLGLWRRDGVTPPATPPGGSELCLHQPDAAALLATHEAWQARSLKIAQAPEQMDFGLTFVALDPDGHRLRVYVPA